MTRPRLYKIQLTQEERDILDKIIKNKNTRKTVLNRCQIIRDLDEVNGTNMTHQQIAHTYAVCLATVENTIKAYIQKGIHEIWRRKLVLFWKLRLVVKLFGER